jgi:hypothetical protein
MRDSIVFYRSFYEAIKEIPIEQQGIVYNAIYGYALDGVEPELNGIAKAIFLLVKPQIDANNSRYENGKKGAEPGKKGGRPKNENPKETPNEPQENPKETPNENVNVNDNVNDLKENTKRKVFAKPTVEEVKTYCTERKNNVDANKFIDFYESKGWLIGKNPMKDRKASIRTWEKTSNSSPPKPSNAYINPSQSEYDDLSMFYSN